MTYIVIKVYTCLNYSVSFYKSRLFQAAWGDVDFVICDMFLTFIRYYFAGCLKKSSVEYFTLCLLSISTLYKENTARTLC